MPKFLIGAVIIFMGITAVLIGATGLVGSEILNFTLNDDRISKVKVFARRTTGVTHPKLEEFIVEFADLNQWCRQIQGDILFSALGTTKKQVGSRDAQRVVDYDYQLRVTQAAKINGIKNCVIVSAPGANPKSWFAYNRIKGELERDVLRLSFPKITIVRPGLLKGQRTQVRFVEQNSAMLLNFMPVIPKLEALKPVSGKLVAHTCVETALDEFQGQRILQPKDILKFSV